MSIKLKPIIRLQGWGQWNLSKIAKGYAESDDLDIW